MLIKRKARQKVLNAQLLWWLDASMLRFFNLWVPSAKTVSNALSMKQSLTIRRVKDKIVTVTRKWATTTYLPPKKKFGLIQIKDFWNWCLLAIAKMMLIIGLQTLTTPEFLLNPAFIRPLFYLSGCDPWSRCRNCWAQSEEATGLRGEDQLPVRNPGRLLLWDLLRRVRN